MSNGKLIVFEGIEGSGKSTQIQFTTTWLREKVQPDTSILVTREPGGTKLGEKIRQLLLTSDLPLDSTAELLLYAADRAQHIAEKIKPHLEQGGWVLCDRFIDSTIAYQGYGRGINPDLINQLNAIATLGLIPDLTLWLKINVEKSLQRVEIRGKKDRMEQNPLPFHESIHLGYQILAKKYPERIITIDANGSIEEVQLQIQTAISQKFNYPSPPFHPPLVRGDRGG